MHARLFHHTTISLRRLIFARGYNDTAPDIFNFPQHSIDIFNFSSLVSASDKKIRVRVSGRVRQNFSDRVSGPAKTSVFGFRFSGQFQKKLFFNKKKFILQKCSQLVQINIQSLLIVNYDARTVIFRNFLRSICCANPT